MRAEDADAVVDVLGELLGGGHDAVEQPELEGAPRGDRLAARGQPERLPLADDAGQPGEDQRGREADRDLGEGEPGALDGDRDVARRDDADAEAGRVALDLGDGDEPGAPQRPGQRDQDADLLAELGRGRPLALPAEAERVAGGADPEDVRVGGRDRLVGKFVDGSESRFEAQYFDVVPEKRLVYAYDMYWQERKISVSLASVEFELAGKGTRLVLTEQHAFLDGYEDAGSRERGTRNLMDNLQVALGGGDTRVPGK